MWKTTCEISDYGKLYKLMLKSMLLFVNVNSVPLGHIVRNIWVVYSNFYDLPSKFEITFRNML